MKYMIFLLSFYGAVVFAQPVEVTKPPQVIPPAQNPELNQPITVPKNCTNEGFSVEGKQLIFNNDKPTPRIFILHNTSYGLF